MKKKICSKFEQSEVCETRAYWDWENVCEFKTEAELNKEVRLERVKWLRKYFSKRGVDSNLYRLGRDDVHKNVLCLRKKAQSELNHCEQNADVRVSKASRLTLTLSNPGVTMGGCRTPPKME